MKAFIEDLRTQRIYRIAAGYLVSSWLILQIAALLSSALGLPNWTLKAVLALLLVGLGAALIIGLRIDVRAARRASAETKRLPKRPHLIFLPIATLFIVVGGTLIVSLFLDANQAATPPDWALQSSGQATVSGTPIPDITLPDGVHVSLGAQEVLIGDNDLGLRSLASNGLAVIENRPGHIRFLAAAGFSTYLLEGTDFKHLNAAPRLVFGPGDPGDFDNGGAQVFAALRSGSSLFAFYQADDLEDLPMDAALGVSGFFLSIGVAESDDDAKTWVKKGQIVRSEKPKEWAFDPHQGGRGIGLAGGVADKNGKQFYIYYTNLSTPQGGTAGQIAVARCTLDKGPPLPGTWKKYYQGDFTEPGLGGKETPVIDVYSSGHAGARYGRAIYSNSLGKYVMVYNVTQGTEWEEDVAPQNSGIYIATSDDLITWSRRVKLVSNYAQRVLGKPLAVAPTLVFDPDGKASGWMIYAYSSKLATTRTSGVGTPTYMVGRRISLNK